METGALDAGPLKTTAMQFSDYIPQKRPRNSLGKLILWMLVFCAVGAMGQDLEGPKSAAMPNIILVMVDDLGWGDTGFNGNREDVTPNLDRIASKGVIFDRFYTAAPVCSPTRASVLTGRNPFRMGIPDANSGHLPQTEVTLPELLRPRGYATGFFGKWHLGTFSTTKPDANRGGRPGMERHLNPPDLHGFGQYLATESKVPTFDPMGRPKVFEAGESLRFGWRALEDRPAETFGTAYWRNGRTQVNQPITGEDTGYLVDHALNFISGAVAREQPFFMTLWPHAPHLPVVADDSHRDLFPQFGLDGQLYYGSIAAMDEQIGRLWDALRILGVLENTIFWFCSDNGPEVDTPGSSGSFRGKKRDLFEGGLRVPAFVVWPGLAQNGTRCRFATGTVDILPTIAENLHLQLPDDRPLDGIDILPKILEATDERENAMGFLYKTKQSWVEDRYKLISLDRGAHFALYDLMEDPSETTDIGPAHPELVKRMTAALSDWLASVARSYPQDWE